MSPKTVRLSPKRRREVIRDNILLNSYEELSKLCGVSERTIIRDVNKWRQEGGFDQFLHTEFFKLYSKERLENPSRALDRICMLLTRRTVQPQLLADIEEIKLKWQEKEVI